LEEICQIYLKNYIVNDFWKLIDERNIQLPGNVHGLLKGCKSFRFFGSTEELAEAATMGLQNKEYEVTYQIPGGDTYTEAIVHRVKNGIAVNYPEPYMRRRDPGTMAIADDAPSDKTRFREKYGYEFAELQEKTFEWLRGQDLAVFIYFAGRLGIGSTGIAIAPANAAFFAMGLSMLQEIISPAELRKRQK
jgi:hypothetical protein